MIDTIHKVVTHLDAHVKLFAPHSHQAERDRGGLLERDERNEAARDGLRALAL